MMRYRPHIRLLFFALLLSLPVMSSAQMYRVALTKAGSIATGYLYIADSTVYKYSSGRGSNYSADTINFDTATTYHFTKFGVPYMVSSMSHKYGATNISVAHNFWSYDSVKNSFNPWSIDSFKVQNRRVIRHTHFSLDYFSAQPTIVKKYYHDYTYDTNGRLILDEETSRGSSIQPPSLLRKNSYIYDANGLLVKDSLSTDFDQDGVWQAAYITEYNYDANGKKVNVSSYIINGQGRILDKENRYYYNTNGELIIDSLLSDNTYFVHKYEYDNNGLMTCDTLYAEHWYDNWLHTYEYTSFGYIKQHTTYRYEIINHQFMLDYATMYFYEEYFPVSVPTVTENNSVITLYPNPATSVLHINTSEAYTQGRIYNSMGQMVQVVNANSQQVNIEALPAGNYYLQLTTNDKVMSKSFTIVR